MACNECEANHSAVQVTLPTVQQSTVVGIKDIPPPTKHQIQGISTSAGVKKVVSEPSTQYFL